MANVIFIFKHNPINNEKRIYYSCYNHDVYDIM